MTDLHLSYRPSEEIIVREIDKEIIIVPLTSGIADMEDELYTLNETGRAIWEKLDGAKSLQNIIDDLVIEYDADKEQIAGDVVGLIEELLKRNMVVAVS